MSRARPSKRIRRPLEMLAQRLTGAETRLRRVDQVVGPLGEDLDALRTEVAALRRDDAQLGDQVPRVTAEAVAREVASLRDELRSLRHAIADPMSTVQVPGIAGLAGDVADLRRETHAGREDAAAAIRQELAGVRADTAALRSELAAVRADTAALRSELPAAQDDAVRALRADIAELRESQVKSGAAIEGLRVVAARSAERDARWDERLSEIRTSREWRWAFAEREPLVSVCIATHNRAALVTERAIASVLRQSYRRWEVVVVGDSCTDDTEERVAALGHPRIRFESLDVHDPYPEEPDQRRLVERVSALNAAAHLAQGSWMAPLNEDCEWTDDHLEILLGAALREKAEIAYGRVLTSRPHTGEIASIGGFPPRRGEFAWEAAIVNTGLRELEYDTASRFIGEDAAWNRARRLWEVGARFTFVDEIVASRPGEAAADVEVAAQS